MQRDGCLYNDGQLRARVFPEFSLKALAIVRRQAEERARRRAELLLSMGKADSDAPT